MREGPGAQVASLPPWQRWAGGDKGASERPFLSSHIAIERVAVLGARASELQRPLGARSHWGFRTGPQHQQAWQHG